MGASLTDRSTLPLYDEWMKLVEEGMPSERAIRLLAARNWLSPDAIAVIIARTLRG